MVKAQDHVTTGSKILFNCDEYRNGDIVQFSGTVLGVRDDGVDVVFLSGYKSRNDFILWKDIIAKIDKRRRYTQLKRALHKGHFLEFTTV